MAPSFSQYIQLRHPPPASPRRPLFAFCAQHAMRRYNEQTSNGEFDVELRADGSDTLLELKEKIAVRSVAPLPPHRQRDTFGRTSGHFLSFSTIAAIFEILWHHRFAKF